MVFYLIVGDTSVKRPEGRLFPYANGWICCIEVFTGLKDDRSPQQSFLSLLVTRFFTITSSSPVGGAVVWLEG